MSTEKNSGKGRTNRSSCFPVYGKPDMARYAQLRNAIRSTFAQPSPGFAGYGGAIPTAVRINSLQSPLTISNCTLSLKTQERTSSKLLLPVSG